jgi:hypothetical protein
LFNTAICHPQRWDEAKVAGVRSLNRCSRKENPYKLGLTWHVVEPIVLSDRREGEAHFSEQNLWICS